MDMDDDDQPMGRRRSTSFIVEDHDSEEEIPDSGSDGSGGGDGELEPYIPPEGGRDRGTSVQIFDTSYDDQGGGGRSRGTSIAIEDDGTSESTEDMVARAANMSKIAARGGTHVGGLDYKPEPNPNKKAPQIRKQEGPIDSKMLGTLQKGLQGTGPGFPKMLTEEQIEELMLVEQEQQKIKEEKEDAKESMASLAQPATKGKKKKTKNTKKMVTRARKNSSASRKSSNAPLDKQEVGESLKDGKTIGKTRSQSDNTDAKTRSQSDNTTEPMPLPSLSEPAMETAPTSVVYKVKLLMLGDSGVGKTCLMRRFCTDSYNEHVLATAGVDFANKKMEVGGRSVEVQIWDTAGQERFHKVSQL
jgi:Ras-related protein Rab-8A